MDSGKRFWLSRKISLKILFARFRLTAFPTLREAITPNLRAPTLFFFKIVIKLPQFMRRPAFRTSWKSEVFRKRCCGGNLSEIISWDKLLVR